MRPFLKIGGLLINPETILSIDLDASFYVETGEKGAGGDPRQRETRGVIISLTFSPHAGYSRPDPFLRYEAETPEAETVSQYAAVLERELAAWVQEDRPIKFF